MRGELGVRLLTWRRGEGRGGRGRGRQAQQVGDSEAPGARGGRGGPGPAAHAWSCRGAPGGTPGRGARFSPTGRAEGRQSALGPDAGRPRPRPAPPAVPQARPTLGVAVPRGARGGPEERTALDTPPGALQLDSGPGTFSVLTRTYLQTGCQSLTPRHPLRCFKGSGSSFHHRDYVGLK